MLVTILFVCVFLAGLVYAQDDSTKEVLKQGLLGAGTGAIAAGATGGKAGQGALIGAGTGVIGGALLNALTTPSSPPTRRVYQQAPPPQSQGYYDDQGDDAYYEEPPPQESGTQKVLKQGLVGAGTGALAAGMSGGKAGQGALIGAGTSVIGGALLDAITQPSQPRRVYRRAPTTQRVYPAQPPQQPYTQQSQVVPQQNVQVLEEPAGPEGGKKKIVKKYDASGKLVSEEEIYY